MSSRILTLFGEEEIIPEQMNAVGKSRAKKTKDKKNEVAAAEKKPKKLKNEPAVTPDLDEWKATKQYYSIGEVAALFKIATSHIRFWTTEFNLKVRTTRKGDRLYTPEQVQELRTIYHLVKENGFTLSGAKSKLKLDKKAVTETVNLKQSLLSLRNLLTDIRNRI